GRVDQSRASCTFADRNTPYTALDAQDDVLLEPDLSSKKEIMIEHRYRPIVEGAVPRDWSGDWSVSEYQKTYCIDREFVRSAKQHKNSSEQWISYILTTGATGQAQSVSFGWSSIRVTRQIL